MLAGLVLVSAVVGAVAMAMMFALSAPTWIALLTYSIVGSLTLLVTAALSSIRTSHQSQDAHLLRSSH
jgi:membrane protein implicated in regulation of membrane protease activity